MNKPIDELVKLVAQQAKVPERVAQAAIDTVLSYLKERLPASFDHHLASLLGEDWPGEKKHPRGLGDMLSRT